jgi:hypothetical protein
VQYSRNARRSICRSWRYHGDIKIEYLFSYVLFCSRLLSFSKKYLELVLVDNFFYQLSFESKSKMVLFTSILTCLAMLLAASAMPLTVPLGTTGQSLSISEDGQTISVDGKVINVRQAMKHAGTCKHGGGRQQHGKGGASSNSTSTSSTNAKAVYFITNAANNAVVALKVAADGTLSDGSITSTGGAGMSGVDSTGAPAAPDSLFSQSAVKVAGNVHLLLQFPISC